ncbi:MAG: dephospho-CoA kinase [Methylobacterium sp.]|nr:MAG: dephospho-CoA kinase [Methylobacterium sp.]
MFRLGLTGSIGTGKSATATLLRELGVPVHDADATVHALYAGRAAPLIEEAFPGTVENGVVDRRKLAAALDGKAERFKALEAIVHPLVREEEEKAIADAQRKGHKLIVLDVPLLYETGGENRCDAVLVTTVSPAIQKARVLARPGMTEELFHALLKRQMPDPEKRRRAHAILETSRGFPAARRDLQALLRALAPRLV